MLCTHCGASNSDEALFCQKCGQRLGITENESTLLSPPPISLTPYESPPYTDYGTSKPIYPPPPPFATPGMILNPYEEQLPTRTHKNRNYLIVITILVVLLVAAGFFELGQFIKGSPQATNNNPPFNTVTNTPIPTTGSNTCGVFSDEFNSNLHAGWMKVDPGGHATFNVATQNLLTMSTTDTGDLNSITNTNAPRLLQPIMGNFTVQTLVDFPTNQHSQSGFQAAGILIWQDENNFIREERYFNSIDFEQVVNGVFSHNAPYSLASSTINGSQFELRVQREGDLFSASWREPGQSWQLINTVNIHLQSIMVGLDLINQGAPQTTAYFHYFRVFCM